MEIEMIEETVKLPKELNDVRCAVKDIVVAVKKAKEDGFDLATDVPAIVLASYQSLVKAIEGVDKVPAEVKTEMGSSIVCASMMGADILKELK